MSRLGSLAAVITAAGALAYADLKVKDGVEAGRIDNNVIKHPDRLFRIEKHHNKGFAGNRLEDRQKFVASVSAAITSVQALVTVYGAVNTGSHLFNAANTLLLAGALSNTKDRVHRRYVVDYIRIKNRVYNLADFYIIAGALLDVMFCVEYRG